MKRVVITGLGAITPVGNDVKTFWNNLLKGTTGAGRITRFDTTGFKTNFACEVKNYDPLNYFEKKEVRKLDAFCQYGLIAGEEAIKDAGLQFDKTDTDRTGVIFSSGIGGFATFEEELLNYFQNGLVPRFSPFFITKIIANSIAGILSIRHGLRGVNYCPVSACSSSVQALIQGYQYIKWGKADIMITGGSEAPITPSSIGGFNSMKALSTHNEQYKTASRPFDSTRDGFVIGEGAGALVIESMESALRRNAAIYAEIVGGAESADAYHISGTHPEGIGAYLAMSEAIKESGIPAGEIDYINAHATSTEQGDISEIKAIEKLFENNSGKAHVSANKSMTGHLLGGTGAIEAIATCLAVKTDRIPPTINTQTPDERITASVRLVLEKQIQKSVHYALSNNFGFGGHCAAVLLKKYED
jgi:3-oxoacyl-[acyl-carrier-protein] synthase II